MNGVGKNVSLARTCLVAVRPFAYTASATSVILGLALSYYAGYPVHWTLFGLTLFGVLCFHTAANLLNDCFDHRRGLDSDVLPTSGAIVRGWVSERQAQRAAIILLALGITCGIVLVYKVGWVVLLLGVLGTIITLGYTRSGFCFKYAGLGDLVIFIAFGALPVFGTYWVQAREFSWLPILWSVPLSSLTVGIVHANNWHDILTDPARNCRTLASMLGERNSARYYWLLMLGPFILVGVYLCAGVALALEALAPMTVLLVMVALPKALTLVRVRRDRNAEVFAMLDGKTAQVQFLFGMLLTITFIIARLLPPV